MNIYKPFPNPVRSMAIMGLIAASSALFAGSTIRITNNSSQPWCLRISQEPTAPVMVQGMKDSTPVELSAQQKLVYHIQPGETCTLQFKDLKDKPMKKDLGLVDKDGTEKGVLRFESHPKASSPTLVSTSQGPCIQSSVALMAEASNILTQDAEDAVSITAPTWN